MKTIDKARKFFQRNCDAFSKVTATLNEDAADPFFMTPHLAWLYRQAERCREKPLHEIATASGEKSGNCMEYAI